MKTLSLFLEAIEPREDSPAVPKGTPVQTKLDLKGAGLRQKSDEDKDHNDIRLLDKTIPKRVRSQIEEGRLAGQGTVDPRAFFVQANPGQRAAPYQIQQHMRTQMPQLMNLQNEASIRKSLDAQKGQHPTLDLIKHRAIMREDENDQIRKYNEGLKEGRITNPKLALQNLFIDAQGNPNHAKSGDLKKEIFKKLIHPNIDEEYEYDMMTTGQTEADPDRMKQLRDTLSLVGYEFDDKGEITSGRIADMTLDEIGERLSSYTWEPDDIHRAMLGMKFAGGGRANNENMETFFDDIDTSIEEGSRNENPREQEPYIGVMQDIKRSVNELRPQLKKAGLLDALGSDHPLNNPDDDFISSLGGELAESLNASDVNSISHRHKLMNEIANLEGAVANPNITDASVNMLIDELMEQDTEDDYTDDKEYFGYNTRYDISDGGEVEGEVDPQLARRINSDDTAEVAWWPLADEKYRNFNMDDPEKFLGDRSRDAIERKLHMVQRFLNQPANKGMSFLDIFSDEESKEKFRQFAKKFTAMDAKQNWQRNVIEDFEEGTVFKNAPMEGGTSANPYENARARIYERMGFGKRQDDGYQYGYKPSSDETFSTRKGQLAPMDEDHGYEQEGYEAKLERVTDDVLNIADRRLDPVGSLDSDYIRNYIMDRMDDIDLDDYDESDINDMVDDATNDWAREQGIYDLEAEFQQYMNNTDYIDEDDEDDFTEFMETKAGDFDPEDIIDLLKDAENGDLHDYIRDRYNEFLEQRGRK